MKKKKEEPFLELPLFNTVYQYFWREIKSPCDAYYDGGNKIYIDESNKEDLQQLKELLIHESVHAIDARMDLGLTERDVLILSAGLAQMFDSLIELDF